MADSQGKPKVTGRSLREMIFGKKTASPKTGQMGNQNMNRMMQAIEDDEMGRMPKGKVK
jgi:hypothetical protein